MSYPDDFNNYAYDKFWGSDMSQDKLRLLEFEKALKKIKDILPTLSLLEADLKDAGLDILSILADKTYDTLAEIHDDLSDYVGSRRE